MFGNLEHSEDHGNYMASMETLLPLICISAVAPSYLRPVIMASALVLPATYSAVRALNDLRKAAVAAANKRLQDLEDGVVHRSDMLQQLFDIVQTKGEKVNFTHKEATLEAWVAL